jgi:rubrerythrin
MKEFNKINDILDFAIDQEQEAVDFYNNLASKLANEAMRKVFEQFAQEEMGHKAKLLDIKNKGIFDISSDKIMDLKIADYTVNVKPSPQMTYQDALILAMNKEKFAFKLYLTLSEKAPGTELKNFFVMLAQEESRHKLRFELEYDEYVLKEN